MKPAIIDTLKQQKGIAVLVVAAGLVTLLGFASLAVDVGLMFTTRNELQNSADAAALAGTNTLGLIYLDMSLDEQATYVLTGPDQEQIKNAAINIAKANTAAGGKVDIHESDIKIGVWDLNADAPAFKERTAQPNAVQVSASRTDTRSDGRVSTFFAKALSHEFESFKASSIATASLNSIRSVEPEELKIPIGMSVHAVDNDSCRKLISFRSTVDSCYGWTAFFEDINADEMKQMCFDLIANHPDGKRWLKKYFSMTSEPDGYDFRGVEEINTGDHFQFNGGVIADLFTGATIAWESNWETINVGGENVEVNQRDTPVIDPATHKPMINGNPRNPAPMFALFDFYRMHDGDNDNSSWTTVVPVYDEGTSDCGNPNKELEIIGFSSIKVTNVNGTPNLTLDIEGTCEISVISGKGGGPNYGNVLGSIPNLVE